MFLPELWEPVSQFVERGGPVLQLIGLTTFLMWVLLIERHWYFFRAHPRELRRVIEVWEARPDRSSWYADQIRRRLISEVSEKLGRSMGLIKTFVALCPLLGLLGTVTGMIEVFDVMAIAGSGNARAMASGVSRATIPTMAGMVAALSGFYPSVWIEQAAQSETEALADHLTHA